MAKTSRPAGAAAYSADPRTAPKPPQAIAQPYALNPAEPTPTWLWATVWGIAAVFYFFWSTRSNGFYQQDEAGHFLGMLDFWNDPKSILGNWAKFGYKLLYVVPAKVGGLTLVTALNCVLAAGAALLIGLALQAQGSRYGLAAFALTAMQPLWLNLAFRNYSEVPTAFLLALGYYLHVKKMPALSMLCISYICTIRQEFYPILAIYGLNLLYRKQWAAALAGAVFPLVQNVYGAYFNHGDYLYLYKQITGQAGVIADAYPRQGGEHYLSTVMVIFGPVAVTLAVQYLFWGALQRQKLDMYLAVPAVLYFTMQVLFNLTSVEIGPATGGNLRYMLVISPLVGGMGALALEQFGRSEKKIQALFYLVPLLVVTAIYLNFKSDLLKLSEDKDGSPTIGVLLAGALLFWQTSPAAKTWVLCGGLVVVSLFMVRPIKRSGEDLACKQLADWYKRNEATYKGRQLYVSHAMFYYYLQRTRHDFTPEPFLLDSNNIAKAPKGAAVFWDSHYSYRPKLNPKAVNYDYFTTKPNAWKMTNEITTPEQNFGVYIFEKMEN